MLIDRHPTGESSNCCVSLERRNTVNGMEGLVALLIPIVALLGITFILAYVAKIRHATRKEMQETIRTALDKGQELSPEVIEQLSGPKKGRAHNLKIGIIWIAVALGTVAFGFGIPDDEATHIFAGMAAIPLFIGLGYVLISRVASED